MGRSEGLMAGCVTEPFGSSGFQTPSDEAGGTVVVSDALLDLYALALGSVQVSLQDNKHQESRKT